jgi:thioredoxin 1
MQATSTTKWPTVAVFGVLMAVGAFMLCQASPACRFGAGSTSTPGDTDMSAAQANSLVLHADQNNFRDIVLQSDVPVLVDFYADWCGPCQRIAPILEELAAEMPQARIVKINVDSNPDLASEYGIDTIPNLKVFKNGAVVDQVVGLAGKSQLRSLLVRY